MALPATIDAGATVDLPGRQHNSGPFKDGNGNYYVVLRAANNRAIEIWKSTDDGDTWSEQDSANHPTVASGQVISPIWGFQDGTILHIFNQDNQWRARYHTFNTSDAGANPDTWQIVNELIQQPTDTDGQYNISGIIRSSGDKVAIFQGDFETIHGTDYPRIDFSEDTGGGWSTPAAVDDAGEVVYHGSVAVLGTSGLVHFFHKDDTNDDIYHSSLDDGSSTPSTNEAINDGAVDNDVVLQPQSAVYYDAAGTERITVLWKRESDGKIYTAEIDDDATPGAEEVASDNAVDEVAPQIIGAYLAVDSETDTVYLIYAHDTDQDIYLDNNVNSGGWGTDTEILDAVSVIKISANIYVNGNGDTVLAYVYNDGGTIKYNEHVIVSGEGIVIGSASLTGLGDTDIAAFLEIPDDGVLVGAGALATDSLVEVLADGSLANAGDLTVDGFLQIPAASALVGAGAIATDAFAEVLADGSLANAGSLTVDALIEILASGQITGLGDLSLAALLEIAANADLSGQGDQTIAALVQILATSELAGNGTLSVSGLTIATALAALVGAGAIATDSFVQIQADGSLANAGDLTVDGLLEIFASAPLSGTGSIIVVGEISGIITGLASLVGTGAIATDSFVEIQADGSLANAGSLTVDALLEVLTGADLTGLGSIIAVGDVTGIITGLASLVGVGAIAIDAFVEILGDGSLANAGDLSVDALIQILATGDLSGSGALVVVGEIPTGIITGLASLIGAGAIATDAFVQVLGDGSLANAGALTVDALLEILAGAELSGLGAFSGAGSVIGAAVAVVVVTPDGRTYLVPVQDRTLELLFQDRTYEIKAEDRVYEVI